MKKSGNNESLLIVDDNFDLRTLLAEQMVKAGYHVYTAANGREAFEIAVTEKICIVITDKEMPNGDGFELLSRLKANNITHPAVFIMTGSSGTVPELAYAMGAEAVFCKPFSNADLLAAVYRYSKPLSTRLESLSPRAHPSSEPALRIALNKVKQDECILGRGGMFVGTNTKMPATGTQLTFLLDITGINQRIENKPGIIEGMGTVRWIRNSMVPGFPAGYGLEFDYLPKHAIHDLTKWSETQGIISFIPSGR